MGRPQNIYAQLESGLVRVTVLGVEHHDLGRRSQHGLGHSGHDARLLHRVALCRVDGEKAPRLISVERLRTAGRGNAPLTGLVPPKRPARRPVRTDAQCSVETLKRRIARSNPDYRAWEAALTRRRLKRQRAASRTARERFVAQHPDALALVTAIIALRRHIADVTRRRTGRESARLRRAAMGVEAVREANRRHQQARRARIRQQDHNAHATARSA